MNSFKLTQNFYFESAHKINDRHVEERFRKSSETIHGHTYHASISILGNIQDDGMVKDFNSLGLFVSYIQQELDHKYLNDIKGLENPTLENLCLFIYNFSKRFKGLCEITVERKASGDKVTFFVPKKIDLKEDI